MEATEPVLCYIEEPWAFFTTQSLDEQWGDDWDDAAYEYNAGRPYTFCDHDRKRGKSPWSITQVAYSGPFETPSAWEGNSPWSVRDINQGRVAWLQTSRYAKGDPVIIHAGCPISQFCELIEAGGGAIYRA